MERIERLISAMTLPEKLGQLTMTAAGSAVTGPVIAGDSTQAIRDGTIGNLLNLVGAEQVHMMQRLAVEESRLGIPLLIGFDVIHGHRTLFPVPLGEAALFDPATWALTAREAAQEAAADGIAMAFAPMIDVARDPRWGRIVESPGEDALVAQRFAEAKVRGFQDRDLAGNTSLAATAKHFLGYAPVTAGREYASVDISERTLREVYLPPFAAAVAAGTAAVMPAFTDLNGIPMTAHTVMLREVLRGHLGFEGVIVSDYNAIAELIHHGIAANLEEAAALALGAGVDIDMMANAYRKGLPGALERGLARIEDIDAAVRRVLTLKERLGLFDAPYGRGSLPETAEAVANRRRLAREVGRRSLVLLTNRANVLPIRSDRRRIAVIGPLADAGPEMRGPWGGMAGPEGQISLLAALRETLPDRDIRFAEGVAIEGGGNEGVAAAIALCEEADLVVLCLGEAAPMSGEAASRADPGLPGRQRALAEAVATVATGLGLPIVAVLFSGRPLTVPWLVDNVDALLAAWFPGSEAGHAVAEVLAGRVSPSGRTPVTWPRMVGQIPLFFSERPTGRPADANDHYTSKYLDTPNTPLFPFGHGLGYGRFNCANLAATPATLGANDTLAVRIEVVNEGSMTAEETLFLFAHDRVASVARPLLELKDFAKITLAPGERGEIAFSLPASALSFLGRDLEPVFETGEVEILVGPSADRGRLLSTTVRLVGYWSGGPP